MQNTIIIENAKKTDLPFLVDFQLKMALETEDLVLDKTVLEKGMTSVLDDPSKARYFVARKGELLAGMLMITLEWSDWRNGWVWWIQSVYVDKEYRKEGVFSISLQSCKGNCAQNRRDKRNPPLCRQKKCPCSEGV